MKKIENVKYGMIYIGFIAALFYWFIEGWLHSFIFEKSGNITQTIPHDIHELWMRSLTVLIIVLFGIYSHVVANRIRTIHERGIFVEKQLNETLTKVLSGYIPICACCKKIRTKDADPGDQKSWQEIEFYLRKVTNANFSHGICPDCARKFYGESGV